MTNQTKAKDALAATLIFGGGFAIKGAILAAAVAAGLLTRTQAQVLSAHAAGRVCERAQRQAWESYRKTGDLQKALKILIKEFI